MSSAGETNLQEVFWAPDIRVSRHRRCLPSKGHNQTAVKIFLRSWIRGGTENRGVLSVSHWKTRLLKEKSWACATTQNGREAGAICRARGPLERSTFFPIEPERRQACSQQLLGPQNGLQESGWESGTRPPSRGVSPEQLSPAPLSLAGWSLLPVGARKRPHGECPWYGV